MTKGCGLQLRWYFKSTSSFCLLQCVQSLDLEQFCYTINTKQAVQTSTLHCCELHVTRTQGLRELIKGLKYKATYILLPSSRAPHTSSHVHVAVLSCHVWATAGVSGPAKEGDGQKGEWLYSTDVAIIVYGDQWQFFSFSNCINREESYLLPTCWTTVMRRQGGRSNPHRPLTSNDVYPQ